MTTSTNPNNGERLNVFCRFCPVVPKAQNGDFRSMPLSILRLHIPCCHVDKNAAGSARKEYICDGQGVGGQYSLCSVDQKLKTLVVNQFVDHLKEEHPEQPIPFEIQYKAAFSDFMTEVCLQDSNVSADLLDLVKSSPIYRGIPRQIDGTASMNSRSSVHNGETGNNDPIITSDKHVTSPAFRT